MVRFDIDNVEKETMKSLKDFQRKTVERIDFLFRNGQNRVLVADEVGLGKTLIARGAIVKTARIRIDRKKNEKKDSLFKVVYICSNTSIANQNIQKLKVSNTARIEGVSDTRLSMLHLKIAEQESDETLKEDFIQLIPLTPGTSFQMTNGGGTVNERALMFAILSRLPQLAKIKEGLERLLIYSAKKAWNYYKDHYEYLVSQLEIKKEGYPDSILSKIEEYNKENSIINSLIGHIEDRESKGYKNKDSFMLNALRIMFARISTEELEPDLVIMDEFQRFKELLDSDVDSDTGILVQKFLNGKDTKVLLLSATPYKLYSTLEEMDELRINEHYSEFLQVTKFLFPNTPEYPTKTEEFQRIWNNYSTSLCELKSDSVAILSISKKKNKAENALYGGMCRTERNSVMNTGDYTDDKSKEKSLVVSKSDVLSYKEACDAMKIIGESSFPIDYVKSCPYLFSFMGRYQVKQKIENYFKHNPETVDELRKTCLWLTPNMISDYKSLPPANARLERLKEVAFENGAEMYLWIPPSKPYYDLQGAFKNSHNFSKILVFSAWEMVPKMIGSMISYEAEAKTIGKLKTQAINIEKNNLKYNANKRYPYPRLNFAQKNGEPQRMNLLCLLYPSKTLSSLYNPIECLNKKSKLKDIEEYLKKQIAEELSSLKQFQTSSNEDSQWYFLAPMLMDGKDFVIDWLKALEQQADEEANEYIENNTSKQKSRKVFQIHIERVREILESDLNLGSMPSDLVQTLCDMTLGSPAVCIYRSSGCNVSFATSLAKDFLNYFNTTEATAVVDLANRQYHAKKSSENTHWQDVLLYCKDGCFQAMFDEYQHIVSESVSFSDVDLRDAKVYNTMKKDLFLRPAQYSFDTFGAFKKRVLNTENIENGEKTTKKLRAHYAVGFVTDGETGKKADRKDRIRGAFNGPLRPFVLASTSIGQEGLDFHNYCRRIVHWNLPSNPIDLEQREGRINRFKCLAIRQNVALEYGDICFKNNIWEEMFDAAQTKKKDDQSDLVPFWCFGENQQIKIERIVPMYPMSKDKISYERLIKILSLYRLTMGQPRQEELLEYIFKEFDDTTVLKDFFINLSPFSKEK